MAIDATMATEEDIAMRQYRARSDKISSIMGGYLLKGWRMLGETCDACDTILLMDREGQTYCIGCSEIDGKHDPPAPAVTSGGGLTNGASGDKQLTPVSQDSHTTTREYAVLTEHPASSVEMATVMVPRAPSNQSLETGPSTGLPAPVSAIRDKLLFCLSRLESCDSAEEIQQWAGAIKGLSEAFVCVKKCSF
ncbi:unnamed protein product [Dibothriocephalus latus]|uniref:Sjoegren syndrome/scleroderma autoantigen 1 n=1 Tax=Dibothriocephalus latus TaxID=60516 RepID=A0A3P7P6W9_DIBLA|nr:unnamed protein product [Dibothriocephalus latus]